MKWWEHLVALLLGAAALVTAVSVVVGVAVLMSSSEIGGYVVLGLFTSFISYIFGLGLYYELVAAAAKRRGGR